MVQIFWAMHAVAGTSDWFSSTKFFLYVYCMMEIKVQSTSFCRISTGCSWNLNPIGLYSESLSWSYCVQSGHGRSISNFHIFHIVRFLCQFDHHMAGHFYIDITSAPTFKSTQRVQNSRMVQCSRSGICANYCSSWICIYGHTVINAVSIYV
jgi:hypothetical protein